MKVMLSIRPQYVDSILAGDKRFEYRRRIFKRNDVNMMAIYSTAPVSAVVAEANVGTVISGTLDEVWGKTSEWAGITYSEFARYFCGCETAFAIALSEVRRLDEPVRLEEYAPEVKRPPQSFVYLSDNDV